MIRLLALAAVAAAGSLPGGEAIARPLQESDLKSCDITDAETRAEELLQGKDIEKVYTGSDFDSFALKVVAPYLLEGRKALFSESFLTCWTLGKRKDPAPWADCLKPLLNEAEAALLERYRACLAGKPAKDRRK